MEENKDGNYEVGYGRPPRHTRFQKGHSGNPKGRPRRSKSLAALLRRALLARVPVRENGRRKTISKLEAVVTQAVNKAVSGDFRAIVFMLTGIPWLPQELAQRTLRKVDPETIEYVKRMMRGTLGE